MPWPQWGQHPWPRSHHNTSHAACAGRKVEGMGCATAAALICNLNDGSLPNIMPGMVGQEVQAHLQQHCCVSVQNSPTTSRTCCRKLAVNSLLLQADRQANHEFSSLRRPALCMAFCSALCSARKVLSKRPPNPACAALARRTCRSLNCSQDRPSQSLSYAGIRQRRGCLT